MQLTPDALAFITATVALLAATLFLFFRMNAGKKRGAGDEGMHPLLAKIPRVRNLSRKYSPPP